MNKDHELMKDLDHVISRWLDFGKNRSMSVLARRSGVAYSTIRRLAQSGSVPSANSVLAIIRIVLERKERISFILKHYPVMGELIDDQTLTLFNKKLNDFLRIEPHNKIFNIIAAGRSMSRSEVMTLFGLQGVGCCEEMIRENILTEDVEKNIFYPENNWGLSQPEVAIGQVRHSTYHFQQELLGTDGAGLLHLTGAVNRETLAEIRGCVLKFSDEIIAIKERKGSAGDIPFFLDLIHSIYDERFLSLTK
ncbi:MAG: hypothetical protein EOP04_02795 [Proteobacteria bacterium]|nr:MAG: hypothetical protein EOP04_02795 [Pseudomonadota bacterium]